MKYCGLAWISSDAASCDGDDSEFSEEIGQHCSAMCEEGSSVVIFEQYLLLTGVSRLATGYIYTVSNIYLVRVDWKGVKF